MEPDLVLADIITTEMAIPAERVVLYDQNYKAPKDDDIYIIISTGADKIISNTNRFDPVENKQVQKITKNTTYNIEITSRNDTAKTRRAEVLMAINSNNAIKQMEDNNIRIFRTSTIQDLSFIEASSSLHRYRISVIINNMETKISDTDYYDDFQTPEVETK